LEEVEQRFIVDANAGKLARWLRMMGYDTLFFDGPDDGTMVKLALTQGRTVITRDTEFMKRRAVSSGRVRALLVTGDAPAVQMQTVIIALGLEKDYRPFSRCLECNVELSRRDKSDVTGSVPVRVYSLQEQYMQCPSCGRIYWRGTHWAAMKRKLDEFSWASRRQEQGGSR
jgi:uncharacterized protein with PIN domain